MPSHRPAPSILDRAWCDLCGDHDAAEGCGCGDLTTEERAAARETRDEAALLAWERRREDAADAVEAW